MRNALGRLKNYKIKRIFRSSGVTGVQTNAFWGVEE
jgi:hypothetical protein